MSFADEYSELRKKRKKSDEEIAKSSLKYSRLNIVPDSVAANIDEAPLYNPKSAEEDIAPVKDSTWFKAGAFDDGYQFGDVTKTILGTAGDIGVGLVKGVAGIAEGLSDLAMYSVAGVADLVGGDEFAKSLKKTASESQTDFVFGDMERFVDGASVLGDKADNITQGLGQVGAIIGTGGLGSAAGLSSTGATILTTGVTGLSSMGGGMSEAYQSGATDGEALSYGAMSGFVDAGTELIFGGLGKAVNAVGLSKGISSLDDAFAKKLSSKISNQVAKNFVEFGVKASAEGAEEVLAGIGSAFAKEFTYMSEEDIWKLIEDEQLLDQFVAGMVTSGIAQSGLVPGMKQGSLIEANKTGTDFITGYTQNEQAVIDKEYENRVSEREQGGEKLTKREKSAIFEQVQKDLEKGFISTDTIGEALGGATYETYKANADSEAKLLEQQKALQDEYNTLNKLKLGEMTGEQTDRKAELKTELEQIKAQIADTRQKGEGYKKLWQEGAYNQAQGTRLAESYNEVARRGQAFEADTTKYEGKQAEIVQKAIDSGILNNTNRTHEFVDMIAKISADKGVSFDFTNNEKLKESGFAVDGKTVNGYVTKDGITINIQSKKGWQSVVGHEISHVLEGTELYTEMQSMLFQYAKTKGDFDGRRKDIENLYKNVKDADVDAELTADLVGDYLFTDEGFIANLSTKHRNVFQKIYDEIKYLLKIATAGSKEARDLERVKKAFDKVYREGGQAQKNTADNSGAKYSLTGKNKDGIEVYETSKDTMNLTWDERRAKYLDVMKNEYRGRTARFVRNGHTYYAEFDQRSVKKPIYGDARSSPNGVKALIKAGADGDVFDLVENAEYRRSKQNTKNHTNADYFDYFVKTVQIDGKVFDLVADVEKKHNGDGGYVYTLALTDNKKIKASPANGSSQSEPFKNAGNASEVSVPQKEGNVKTQFSLSSDSDGKQLSPEQQDYFKDSKVLDEDGNLKVMYHGSQDAGFHVFDPAHSDDETSLFFVDRNDVAASYSGTTETYEAQSIRTAEDMNKFMESIGAEGYEVVEKDGKFTLLYEGDRVADSNTAKGIYEEFCWYEGVGDGDANYKVYLNLKNPLEVDAEGRNWNNISREFSQEVYDRYQSLTAEEKAALTNLAEWGEYSIFKDEMLDARAAAEQGVSSGFGDVAFTKTLARAYAKLGGANANLYDAFSIASDNFSEEALKEFAVKQMNTRDYAKKAKAEGYDGVIFKNIVDVGGYGNGSEGASTVAVAFDSNQVKSVANDKPTKNADIRKSLSKDGEAPTKHGSYYTPLEELAYDAPVQETTENVAPVDETVAEAAPAEETVAPVAKSAAGLVEIAKQARREEMQGAYNHDGKQYISDGSFIAELNTIDESLTESASFPIKRVQKELAEVFDRQLDSKYEIATNIADGYIKVGDSLFDAKYVNAVIQAIENPVFTLSHIRGGDNALLVTGDNGRAMLMPVRAGDNVEVAYEAKPVVDAPIADMPDEQNLQDLYNEKEALEVQIRTAMEENDHERGTPLIERYNELMRDIEQMEADDAQRRNSLTDADVPPEVEAPYYESEPATVDDPFDSRDIDKVGNRKVNAYMFENPEVKPFFQEEANVLLGELERTEKPETIYNGWLKYEMSYEAAQDIPEVYRTSRVTTEDIAYLRDEVKMSYADIEKGIKAIIEDHGAENIAAAKKIEFILNDRLLYGYNAEGVQVPPNQDYINLLNEKQITEYNDEARKRFFEVADEYAPVANEAPVAETATEDIAPVAERYEEIRPKREAKSEPRLKRVDSEEARRGGHKERSWVETSTESEAVDGVVTPDEIPDDVRYYKVKSNKKTLAAANARLDKDGFAKAREYFEGRMSERKLTVEDIALGERLIQEAAKAGDAKAVRDLIIDVSILGTELGQQVQALSIIQRLTPEGQLKALTRVVERGKAKGDKAFDGVEVTDEMTQKILGVYKKASPETVKKLQDEIAKLDGATLTKTDSFYVSGDTYKHKQKLKELGFKWDADKKAWYMADASGTFDQAELDRAVDEVKQQIADQMKVTKWEKANAWRYLSMLGNPKTHGRNVVSNVAMFATRVVKNAMARTIEDIAPIESRTKTWKRATDAVREFAKQTTKAEEATIKGDNKYSAEGDIKNKRKVFESKILAPVNAAMNLNNKALDFEDAVFSKYAYRRTLQEYLTANGIRTEADIKNNPELITQAKQYALEEAQRATFRQDSYIANKISEIEKKNKAFGVAVGSIMPFKKTPINIAKTGMAYSPLGFARNIYDAVKVSKGEMDASTAIDHLAQTLTGTSLALIGYALASAGVLNGAGEDDKEGKYDYQLGEQSYSFNFGGDSYSLSWLSPVAMPLFVGANAYEQLVEKEEWDANMVIDALGQTLDPMSEMSFVSSLDDVLSSYDSGMAKIWGAGESMIQNYATQFIPTLSSQVAATFDDTKRSTKASGDSGFEFGEETLNKIIYKIPGLRNTLEPTTDIWGNEYKQNENVPARFFESFLSPANKREGIATEVDNELKSLYGETGKTELLPSIPYNYINYKDVKYDMSAEDYTAYKQAYGQTAYDMLESLFATSTYQNADAETRADLVSDVYDYARDLAKREYLAKQGVDFYNATEDNEEVYKENPIKGAIENDVTPEEYSFSVEYPEKYAFFKKVGIAYSTYEAADEDGKRAYSWAYDNQGKYTMSKAIADDFLTYYQYKSDCNDFDAKDENGETVSGLKKERVIEYINNLDIDYGSKIILFRSMYDSKEDISRYNGDILDYLNSRDDISYEDTVTILKELGFTVHSNGRVTW